LKQIKHLYHLSKNKTKNKENKMRKYNVEHEWVLVEGNVGTVGVSAYAVGQLGDITFLELPEVGDEVSSGDSVAFIESVKAATDIYTPVSGTVTEINENLLDAPEVLNEDVNANWIYKMELSDDSELESLMDEEAYAEYLNTL
jgi:glycine cleavage system H protein